MKRVIIYIITFCLFINISPSAKASTKLEDTNTYNTNMKQDILCLMMGYPEYVAGVQRDNSGYVYIIMKSGKKILYDDKKEKSFQQKLASPDLQDTLEQIYPLVFTKKLMDKNFDPGRFRNYALLSEVYGQSRQQIEQNLKNVRVGYSNCLFNKNNGAAQALQNVMKELTSLSASRPDIRRNVFPCSGTYNYRLISGTNQLSPHGYAIAIDLARDNRDYWQWATPQQGEERLVSYPKEIVDIFEKNNFVWGGKWNHFDILHYEYRPEIILKARYFSHKSTGEWYDGVGSNEDAVKGYISKINEALK
ncbi:MAG: M15 family metallopeptidase [Bacillota bacterium]|nr:M15 family metallopeptidase [Bacillota bacterium]